MRCPRALSATQERSRTWRRRRRCSRGASWRCSRRELACAPVPRQDGRVSRRLGRSDCMPITSRLARRYHSLDVWVEGVNHGPVLDILDFDDSDLRTDSQRTRVTHRQPRGAGPGPSPMQVSWMQLTMTERHRSPATATTIDRTLSYRELRHLPDCPAGCRNLVFFSSRK